MQSEGKSDFCTRVIEHRKSRQPKSHLCFLYQVDGGLAPSTIDAAASAGANVIVAGTAIASAADQAEAIRTLRSSVDKWAKRKD